MGYFTFLMV